MVVFHRAAWSGALAAAAEADHLDRPQQLRRNIQIRGMAPGLSGF